jgi:hypothetical protein
MSLELLGFRLSADLDPANGVQLTADRLLLTDLG